MLYLAVDIGGTEFKYAHVNEKYEIIDRGVMPTFPKGDYQGFEDTMEKLYLENPNIEGISISMPGLIDTKTGYCAGSSLGFGNYYVAEALQKKIPVDIVIDNDGFSATIAEGKLGALKDVDCGVFLAFGTGIGGGLIIDGKCYKGKRNMAGNVSFILNRAEGDETSAVGATCSTGGLVKKYAELKNVDVKEVNGRILMNNFRNNEPEAIEALQTTCYEAARIIYNLAIILNPEKIAIGGGLSADPLFIGQLQKAMDRLRGLDRRIGALANPVIVPAQYRNDANLLGALIELIEYKNNKK